MTDKEQDNMLSGETPLAREEFSTTSLPSKEALHFELQNIASGEEPCSLEPVAICSSSGSPSDYDVVERIGGGGMGTVYRARHKVLNKTVAIKMLHKELAGDPVNLRRFQIEATAAGSLTHANLAAVYDSGVTEDGTPYLVMDYLQGVSLDAILKKEGFLEYDRFFNIFGQVCEALTHAHSKSIVHRDLKPSNIVIVRLEGGHEHVKLVDFGIARVLQRSLADGSRLTQTGEVIGSPDYMSPEQCLGLDPDQRSDIYSLGVVMYEALAGRPPFRGDNNIQIIVAHINKEPRLISKLRPDLRIPLELEDLIMKALSKEPEKRFQSVKEMGKDLQRIKDSKKSRLRSGYDSVVRHMRNGIGNKRKGTIIGGVIGGCLLASLGLVMWKQNSPTAQVPVVVKLTEETSEPKSFQHYLDQAQLAVVRGKPQAAAGFYRKAIDTAIKSKFTNESVVELYTQAANDVYMLAYRNDYYDAYARDKILLLAEPFYEQAIALSRSSGANGELPGELMTYLAEIKHSKRDYASEERIFREIVAKSAADVSAGYEFPVYPYGRLAAALERLHRYGEAENTLKYAISNMPDHNDARWQLAKLYLRNGKMQLADQQFRELVSRALHEKDHDRLAGYLLRWEALLKSDDLSNEAAKITREITKHKIVRPLSTEPLANDPDQQGLSEYFP